MHLPSVHHPALGYNDAKLRLERSAVLRLCNDRDFAKRLLLVLEKHKGESPLVVASWREYLIEHGLAEP